MKIHAAKFLLLLVLGPESGWDEASRLVYLSLPGHQHPAGLRQTFAHTKHVSAINGQTEQSASSAVSSVSCSQGQKNSGRGTLFRGFFFCWFGNSMIPSTFKPNQDSCTIDFIFPRFSILLRVLRNWSYINFKFYCFVQVLLIINEEHKSSLFLYLLIWGFVLTFSDVTQSLHTCHEPCCLAHIYFEFFALRE